MIFTFIIIGILYVMITYPWNWLIKMQVEKYGYQNLLSLVDDTKLKCVKNKGILINRNNVNHLDIIDIFCESNAFIIFLDRFIASGNGMSAFAGPRDDPFFFDFTPV